MNSQDMKPLHSALDLQYLRFAEAISLCNEWLQFTPHTGRMVIQAMSFSH
jgi:hypothetical protein